MTSQFGDIELNESIPFNNIEAVSHLLDYEIPFGSAIKDNGNQHPRTHPAQSQPRRLEDFQANKRLIGLPRILECLLKQCSELHAPICQFEVSDQAAKHNLKVLKANNFDLDRICKQGKRSVLPLGSEFKDISQLENLLGHHPRWNKLKSILTNGVHFHLVDMNDKLRLEDLDHSYQRGNHKSAEKCEGFLSKAMRKEIELGWSLILPGNYHKEVPGLMLNHMGVAPHTISSF